MNRDVRIWIAGWALAVVPMILRAQEPPPEPPQPPAPAAVPVPPVPPIPNIAPMPAMAPLPPMPVMPPLPAMAPLAPMPMMPPMPALAPLPPMPPVEGILAPIEMAMMFDPQNDEDRARAQAERDRERAERDRERAEHERERALERGERNRDTYRRGMSYLDHRDYDRAVQAFNQVIENKTDRADGALYWRAYAQNKLGKREDAMATIAELQKSYPQSRWLEDSKALQVEIRAASGQPPAPEDASDEDLKLLALNALMNSDPDRSIPTLEKLLHGPASPRVKERALFVLAQSRSQKARELLGQVAKGTSNPDVQLKAIEYLGINRSAENQQLLSDVYKSSNDAAVKRAILRSFMISHNRDALLQAARSESNPELRLEAIRQLGVMGGAPELYSSESTYEGKRAILQGMMQSGDAAKLLEIAKTERDPKLRSEAINLLGVMGRGKTGDGLVAMYRQDTDPGVKRSIINALFIQQNAPALVDLAKKETDPAMKKELVSRLSVMHSKESTDYLMELLNK